jgi:hypothetical protein
MIREMDPGLRLRQEFASQQRSDLRKDTVGQARKGVTSALAGAATGVFVMAVMTFATRVEAHWYTYLLEVGLYAFSGLMLRQIGGGLLKGAFVMPLAYGAAYLLRQTGFDPASWLGKDGAISLTPINHLIAVCVSVACGALLGYWIESRNT